MWGYLVDSQTVMGSTPFDKCLHKIDMMKGQVKFKKEFDMQTKWVSWNRSLRKLDTEQYVSNKDGTLTHVSAHAVTFYDFAYQGFFQKSTKWPFFVPRDPAHENHFLMYDGLGKW